MLGELEKRLEGVSAGVKEVLLLAKEQPDGPFQQVRGMLADLLQVSVESAALVEVALGERAQYLVVAPGGVLAELSRDEPAKVARPSGLSAAGWSARRRVARPISRRSDVLGRAADFVESRAEVRPLVERLLGHTWIVENLTTALELLPNRPKQALRLSRSRLKWSAQMAQSPPDRDMLGSASFRVAASCAHWRCRLREWERRIAEGERITAELEHEVYQRELRVVLAEHGAPASCR